MTTAKHLIDALLPRVASGDLVAVKAGLADKLNVNLAGSQGWTLLICACRNGHLDIVNWLLANGADPNVTNARGTTPLMYAKTAAFASGRTTIMDALIDAGADIDAVDDTGQTALEYTQQRAAMLIDYFKTKGLSQ